jgi:hypothetical protein
VFSVWLNPDKETKNAGHGAGFFLLGIDDTGYTLRTLCQETRHVARRNLLKDCQNSMANSRLRVANGTFRGVKNQGPGSKCR